MGRCHKLTVSGQRDELKIQPIGQTRPVIISGRFPIFLKLQLSYFEHVKKKLQQQEGRKKTQELLSKAVYLLSMGGNDYMKVGNPKPGEVPLTDSEKKEYVTIVLGNITSTVKKVYAMGGRKFLFQAVGPLGCMPATRVSPGAEGCSHEVMSLAKMHNTAMSNVLRKLEKTLPGFKYSLFDYFSTLASITNYAPKYGFKEGQAACCSSGHFNGAFTCANTTAGFNLCHDPTK
ncbi:GDSL esterase/lipase 3-like [Punica granatum]|uniref:GDSL esterase/lipase 3-like n=2 Tax=Punica granatum TaxID=22663 RepID=A0A6P8BWL3_PUNGR|nr:GDSL esterase/lipase 3-like [Punica granatum]